MPPREYRFTWIRQLLTRAVLDREAFFHVGLASWYLPAIALRPPLRVKARPVPACARGAAVQ